MGRTSTSTVLSMRFGGDPATWPDAQLVADAQRDTSTFSLLFDRYWDQVFRFCYYRTGNWHDAEDIASQSFVNALANLNRFHDDGREESFRCWLFTIARNLLINTGRERDRTAGPSLDSAAELASREPGPEDAALSAERHRLVHVLLLQVTPDQRELIELRLTGLTAVEIARVLGRTHGSVRVAQHRAIETLRKLMSANFSGKFEDSNE